MSFAPLVRFWTGQLADMQTVAEQPPAWCSCMLPEQSALQGRHVNQMSPADLRASIWMAQSKAMGFIVAAFFSSIALFITALLVSDFVMQLTAVVLGPLFAIPVAGIVFSAVIYTFEVVNIALGTVVLIGKLTTKVLVPAANRCTAYAEALDAAACARRPSRRR